LTDGTLRNHHYNRTETEIPMTVIDQDIEKLELLQGARFLRAFLECNDAIQKSIVELLGVVCDSEVDPDDRDMALFTLSDCLFPHLHKGKLGLDLEESEQMGASNSGKMRVAIEELDQEEATFAERLKQEMDRLGLTQETLAAKVGVGQSAISNMLLRQCRPQQKTIFRFAEALGVPPESLWPSFIGNAG